MPNRRDPKEIVTPHAFRVAPDLLGLPLATPWRRGVAMLVDLLLIGLLVLLKEISLTLFSLALAWALFRISSRSKGVELRGAARVAVRGAAVVSLLVALGALIDACVVGEPGRRAPSPGVVTIPGPPEPAWDKRWRDSVVRSAVAESAVPSPAAEERSADADSLARLYATALAEEDSARARELRGELAARLSGERLEALRAENRRLRRALAAVREEAEREPGILGFLGSVAEDIGLGFGWAGLYFTIFLAAWRGQTPGKRLLGIRVVRLNGEPLGWWPAFERFGGYAASLATGLIGFLQILWDGNRQGVHDKIGGTVVVRDVETTRRALAELET